MLRNPYERETADVVRRNPNVIVSSPLAAHLAAKQATATIPIVMASVADPVAFGLAQSLSHPGGNLTGLGNFADVLASSSLICCVSSCRACRVSLFSSMPAIRCMRRRSRRRAMPCSRRKRSC